jgi:hypothetical protein
LERPSWANTSVPISTAPTMTPTGLHESRRRRWARQRLRHHQQT